MFDGTKLNEIMLEWKPKKFTNNRMIEELSTYDIKLTANSLKAYRNCRADPSTKTLSVMANILNIPVIDLLTDTKRQAKIILSKYNKKEDDDFKKFLLLSEKNKEIILLQIKFLMENNE